MFKDQGFLDIFHNWHIEKGNFGQLLSCDRKTNQSEDYTKLLDNHPYLTWIHQIGADNFSGAAHSLKSMADKESVFMDRQKMMLTLSSLSALAADGDVGLDDHLTDVETRLENIDHQNKILQSLGKDSDCYPPNKTGEIIELCLNDNTGVLENCYMSVLHAVSLIKDIAIKKELINAVLCKCILSDSWEACQMLQLNVIVKEKLFTKALQCCSTKDTYKNLIPDLQTLNSSSTDLNMQMESNTFIYQQLKACYEVINISS